MRFIDILESKSTLSCELLHEELDETPYSFEWDDGCELSDAAREHFKKVLNSPCRLDLSNIYLLDPTLTYEELLEFTSACAGYCSTTDYDIWFKVTA